MTKILSFFTKIYRKNVNNLDEDTGVGVAVTATVFAFLYIDSES